MGCTRDKLEVQSEVEKIALSKSFEGLGFEVGRFRGLGFRVGRFRVQGLGFRVGRFRVSGFTV